MSRLNHSASLGILALICLFALPAFAMAGGPQSLEERRQQCTAWMTTGYPSGLVEKSCINDFGLPSPFLFVCAKAQRSGFESENQKKACSLFFAKASADASNGVVRR